MNLKYLCRKLACPTLLFSGVVLSPTLQAQVNVTVNATQAIRAVDERVFGVNAVIWDPQAGSAQTITMIQNAGIRTIRVPGGSLSDDYHWRINKSLTNTWTWSTAFNGFINLITSTNTQPVVTANYGSGTPEEAAGLVAYLNANVGSSVTIGGTDGSIDQFPMQNSGYWAALRAAAPLGSDDGMNFLRISRAGPVGAKYFEIGNECYGSWETDQQTVKHDPTTYANRVQQYITKMKAVDPTIKIGVVAVTSSENGSYQNWTPTMLARLKVLNAIPDFLIYHLYPQGPGGESDATLLQVADAGSRSWRSIADDLRNQLNTYLTNQASGVEIVVTENNSVYSSPGKQSTSLVNGLYLADSIGNLMQTQINGYMYWALRNGTPTINNEGKVLDGNMSSSLYGWRQFGDYGMISTPSPLTGETTYYNPYPTYYMMKLLSHFARGGDTIVQATSSNPLLSIFAAKRADGSLSLLMINKDPANTLSANVMLAGYTPPSSATIYSYGKPQDLAGGTADIVSSNMSVPGSTFTASFASYSATVLSFGVSAPSGTTHSINHSDFTGDGKGDLLWTNTVTGERSMWFLNGSTTIGGSMLNTVPVAWVVSGTGDFDGDGKADVVLTNTLTGDRVMWLMNGSTITTNAFMGTVPVDWVISGTGDFNGDGKADIVWTNTVTGDRAMWLMNGSTVLGGGYLGTVPVVWTISGVGDFNGDGKADLVWSNTVTGERSMWFQNGGTTIGGATLNTVPVAWVISGVGDFNGDGKADIFLTNTVSGDRVIWLMNGSTITTNEFMGTVPVAWAVSSVGDFDGDGKSDLVWTNTATGDRAMWLINGSTVTGGGFMGTVPIAWKINY